MIRARSKAAKDQRRQDLLAAALDEFYERGYAAARLDDIARRANTSKGAFYRYFESKSDLFLSLVQVIAVPNVARFEMLAKTSDSIPEFITTVMEQAPAIIRETSLPKIIKVLIADAPAFPDLIATYRESVIERAFDIIADVIERGKERGEIDVSDTDLTATLIVAPIALLAIWRAAFETPDNETIDLDALFALHGQLLIRALGVDASD